MGSVVQKPIGWSRGNAPFDSIECWADRPVVQLTKQVKRVIEHPMNVVRIQFAGVAHIKTLDGQFF